MATIVIIDGIKYKETIIETETGSNIKYEVLDDSGKHTTAQDDTDAMLVDHEYRITMLELDLTE